MNRRHLPSVKFPTVRRPAWTKRQISPQQTPVEREGDALDLFIKWSTLIAVLAAAAIGGWVSYVHALDVVSAHGEHGILAHLYPGTIDGLVYSASMVLLDSARRGIRSPLLAKVLLALGIGATMAANILSGLSGGWLSSITGAWPAIALVGSYELLMMLVRRSAQTMSTPIPPEIQRTVVRPHGELVYLLGGLPAFGSEYATASDASAESYESANEDAGDANVFPLHPESIEARAVNAFGDAIASGASIPTLRQIQDRLKIGQPKAQQAQTYLRNMGVRA